MIPKIIHTIAPTDKSRWHPFWHRCLESWTNKFPDHKFMMWNDSDDLDRLVKDHYPRFWNLYNAFPVQIMKIDFARLCILHRVGGIYTDMDIYCYRNFDNYLRGSTYFLENLTHEYTNAQWENSMMASEPNSRLFEELIKYAQVCFIQLRNTFTKQTDCWRSLDNDRIVNNTTGSGMLSEAVKHFSKYFPIDVFECSLFNNRPASYHDSFYTKHMHTSIWGNEYINRDLDRLLLLNGSAYSTGEPTSDMLQSLSNRQYKIILNHDFDFYKDYTDGIYLRSDNLDEIRTIVSNKY